MIAVSLRMRHCDSRHHKLQAPLHVPPHHIIRLLSLQAYILDQCECVQSEQLEKMECDLAALKDSRREAGDAIEGIQAEMAKAPKTKKGKPKKKHARQDELDELKVSFSNNV